MNRPRTAKAHNQAQGVGHVDLGGGVLDATHEVVVHQRGALFELEGWIDNQIRENGIREDGTPEFRAGRGQALAQVKREIGRLMRGAR
jgi:hypothetical protein